MSREREGEQEERRGSWGREEGEQGEGGEGAGGEKGEQGERGGGAGREGSGEHGNIIHVAGSGLV